MKGTLQAEHILNFSIRVRAEIRLWGPSPLLEQSPLLELLGFALFPLKLTVIFGRNGIFCDVTWGKIACHLYLNDI